MIPWLKFVSKWCSDSLKVQICRTIKKNWYHNYVLKPRTNICAIMNEKWAIGFKKKRKSTATDKMLPNCL